MLLQLTNISHSYGKGPGQITVLNELDLNLEAGEILCIVGRSGCGKTTWLRLLAGLETATDPGNVKWRGHCCSLEEVAKSVAYMPQTSSLLPWRTVVDNIALPLRLRRGKTWKQARETARGLLQEFGLANWATSYPAMLSGGMASRISFLRASAQQCPLLLLDEPFGALDALSREHAQTWLERAWMEQGQQQAGIFITHSLGEAVALGDRVLVMGQCGQPLAGQVRIDLPRPRDTTVRTSPEFASYVREVTRLLENTGSGENPGSGENLVKTN